MTGRSLVALVLTAVAVVVAGVVAILLATRSDATSIFDLEVGDCFSLPGETGELETFDLDTVDVLDCAEPHDAEVVGVGRLNPERDRSYPADDELFAEADRRCADELTGATFRSGLGRFGVVSVVPNEASWEPLAGGFVCIAIPAGGGPVTGSIAGP